MLESSFFMDGHSIDFAVMIRPFAVEFMKWAYKQFDIDIFTAARREYALEALKICELDSYVRNLYQRDHCLQQKFIVSDGKEPMPVLVKDLRIFDREISDILIVDNTLTAYAVHIANAVPLISW